MEVKINSEVRKPQSKIVIKYQIVEAISATQWNLIKKNLRLVVV